MESLAKLKPLQAGGTVTGFSVLLELEFLGARAKLAPREVHALLAVA